MARADRWRSPAAPLKAGVGPLINDKSPCEIYTKIPAHISGIMVFMEPEGDLLSTNNSVQE